VIVARGDTSVFLFPSSATRMSDENSLSFHFSASPRDFALDERRNISRAKRQQPPADARVAKKLANWRKRRCVVSRGSFCFLSPPLLHPLSLSLSLSLSLYVSIERRTSKEKDSKRKRGRAAARPRAEIRQVTRAFFSDPRRTSPQLPLEHPSPTKFSERILCCRLACGRVTLSSREFPNERRKLTAMALRKDRRDPCRSHPFTLVASSRNAVIVPR